MRPLSPCRGHYRNDCYCFMTQALSGQMPFSVTHSTNWNSKFLQHACTKKSTPVYDNNLWCGSEQKRKIAEKHLGRKCRGKFSQSSLDRAVEWTGETLQHSAGCTHRHSNFSAFVQVNLCWVNWRIFWISLTAKMPMLTASRTVRLGKTRGFRKPAWKASAWASTYTSTDGRTTRKHNAFDLIYPKGRGTNATSSP